MKISNAPAQPANWKFVEELKTVLHKKIIWKRCRKKAGEASLNCGVLLDFRFPDTTGCLNSAYADFKTFLRAGKIKPNGTFRIITDKTNTTVYESYKLEVSDGSCKILAGDTEGIRRALVFLEDEILRNQGPFIKKGVIERKPLIKTRISRCFFGPIRRSPMNRDELADNENYYPDEYLNRLAHEGVNALWLTVRFHELCPSEYFPEHGKGREQRLKKLRKTVRRCARYGIKIYIFCIEPTGFGENSEHLAPASALKGHPYFAGHKANNVTYFCTSSKQGREYLENCAYYIFSEVPGLGGLIDINLGERPTHCYSCVTHFFENNCPRCAKRKASEVFADTTAAIARGIKKANPDAEMISWLYVPTLYDVDEYDTEDKKEIIRDIAAHVPENVVLQYNFESNGIVEQLGKERLALDYWLSWPGPSKIFEDCAKNAIKNSANVSAKIQVGCSHEVATVPFVPVPGNLYKKYKAMHEIGVSVAMQCWFFGNYPGLMNKAAGELSFSPCPRSEDEFLRQMAQTDWGGNAKIVVKAWKYFQKSYSSFPINLPFTWMGPVHDSVTWPLHLFPADKPIAPSWKLGFPVSGDRIGECICFYHTMRETLLLLKKMDELWEKGIQQLLSIEHDYSQIPERQLDIGLAKALGLQIKSARNVFEFYHLRENLFFKKSQNKLKKLEALQEIVFAEIDNSLELEKLCRHDSRLGFHSEAEGYKYFPAKLLWRVKHLKKLLNEDFPELKRKIINKNDLFPEYTGKKPQGKSYICGTGKNTAQWEQIDKDSSWQAFHDRKNIYFTIKTSKKPQSAEDKVEIAIEPKRLWPTKIFMVSFGGKKTNQWRGMKPQAQWQATVSHDNLWTVRFTIPFACIREENNFAPLRINISRLNSLRSNLSKLNGRETISSWISKKPLTPRLIFGSDNSNCLGWMIFR